MGFGCNAAGVTSCRIIDSERERLIAIITNCFVPCNGRFPTLIAIISMFFIGASASSSLGILSAAFLTLVILFGIAMTLAASWLLSKTLLKGVPSYFTLELPPYRVPVVSQILVRSLFDRTLKVLTRAVIISMPAGAIIWVLANTGVNGQSTLRIISNFLDPSARLIGLDGVILLAFILGLPANEIVLPIAVMAYGSLGRLVMPDTLPQLRAIFVDNGWTISTALCTIAFMLMHWPCATTLATIKKETGSIKWVLVSVAVPTVFGILTCLIINNVVGMIAAA